MAKSPLTENTDLISFNVLSNGLNIPETTEITAIEIEQEMNAYDQAFITLNDGLIAGEAFNIANSKTFELGNQIEIKLGYHNKNTTVFKGSIKRQLLDDKGNGSPQLNIICNSSDDRIDNTRHAEVDLSKTPILKLTYGVDVLGFELLLHKDDPMQIEGVVSFQGSTNANINDTLILRGFSDKFNTTYVISKVIQHVSDGDWITTVSILGKL